MLSFSSFENLFSLELSQIHGDTVIKCLFVSTVLCQQALSDILTFLQETQKRDFKFLSFLSSFGKNINNSTPDYRL